MHTVKETDMLAAKLDLLLKKLDEGNWKQMPVPIHAMNSYSTCEVCGDGGHSGNDYPETRKDAAYINNNNTGFRRQGGQGGVNHTHHSKEEVTISTQISIRISIRTNPP